MNKLCCEQCVHSESEYMLGVQCTFLIQNELYLIETAENIRPSYIIDTQTIFLLQTTAQVEYTQRSAYLLPIPHSIFELIENARGRKYTTRKDGN